MLCLSDEDRKTILDVARQGVFHAAVHGHPLAAFPKTGIFAERCGLFVSLHAGKKLRGCIGIIESAATLGENLVQSAADAALHDPRFSPVRPEEVDGLNIEVSLLSPMRLIRPEEVEIGRHGLLVERGGRLAVATGGHRASAWQRTVSCGNLCQSGLAARSVEGSADAALRF